MFGAIFLYFLGYRPSWPNSSKNSTSMLCSKTICDIPGPIALPILGTRWVYSKLGGYTFGNIHIFYKDMFLQHGPVLKEEALWNIPVISIVERADIERVLRSSGKYPIRPPTEAIAHYRRSRPDRYTSTGMVNEQGEMWHYLRNSLTSELTSPRTIANFQDEVDKIADDWCHLIRHHRSSNGLVENLEILAGRLGLEAICSLVLGRRMGFLLPEGESEICKKLAEAVHSHFKACRDTYYGLPLWKLYPTDAYNRLVQSEEAIYDLALELVRKADDSTKESVVFQSVLNANVDENEKTAAMVDFIAAGIHTLGNSLVFLLYLISRHEKCQHKIFEELTNFDNNVERITSHLDTIAHNNNINTKLNNATNANNKPYLKACVSESFRLLPTANCLARIIESPVEVTGGFRLPSGSVILCHTGLACRDDRNFTKAEEFKPERWISDGKQETSSAATFLVLPFGVGKRACPGKRFIEQVLPSILASTIRNFDLNSTKDMQLQFEFILSPKGPIEMTFTDRI